MRTQETTSKYTLWGETDQTRAKHDREPNPSANWHEIATLIFTPDTKIYEEEAIPRIRGDIRVNNQDEVLVMDCTTDCRHLYWYLESHPGGIYFTPRQKYDVDGFAYSKGELAGGQYAMLNGMTDALELVHPMNTVYLLDLRVDKAIERIDRYLKSVKMG